MGLILDAFLKMIGWRCEHRFTWPRSYWHGPEYHRYQVHRQTCVRCGLERKYKGELVS